MQLLHDVLEFAGPRAAVRFGGTCRLAHSFIDGDSTLWRSFFLSSFDDSAEVASYREAVQERERAGAVVRSRELRPEDKVGEFRRTIAALLDVASSPMPASGSSNDAQWLRDAFGANDDARRLFLLGFTSPSVQAATRLGDPELRSQAARLHALHMPLAGACLAPPERIGAADDAALLDERARLRRAVYDKSSFGRDASWGPFKPRKTPAHPRSAGSAQSRRQRTRAWHDALEVDWEKVEAVQRIMALNLQEAIEEGWGDPALDRSLREGEEAVRPPSGSWEDSKARPAPANERDWAGVEASEWRGTYAFLDYRDWDHFNHHHPRGLLLWEHEAVGDTMALRLRLLPPGERIMRVRDLHTDDDFFDPDSPMTAPDNVSSETTAALRTVMARRASLLRRPQTNDDSDEEDESSDDDFVPDGVFLESENESDSSMAAASSSGEAAETSEADEATEEIAQEASEDETPPTSPPDEHGEEPLSFMGTTEPLHFNGTFASHARPHMAPDRSIRGTVRRMKDGAVHWEMIIRYMGADQWLMHGVQVNVGARAGIFGTWSTADHDDAGPHGPFWYWPQQQSA